MIDVAVVIDTLGRGGAERLLVDTARGIDRAQFRLSVFTLSDAATDYAETLTQLGVPLKTLGLSRARQFFRGAARLRTLLSQQPVDVVHTHLFWGNAIGRIAAFPGPATVVSSYHDADYEDAVREGNPTLTPAKQVLLRGLDYVTAVLSGCHCLAVSEYVARSLYRRLRLSPARVSVISNAIDTTLFRPDARLRAETRQALGLGAEDRVILSVGRMTPQKGQSALILALRSPRLSTARLLLVGRGNQEGHLRALARESGLEARVSFLGSRGDVPALMRAADVFALPSLHEGFGLVLVEALASGTPVVASRVGPVPEIVIDGETGVLVPPKSPADLANAISSLLHDSDRRRSMAERGRQDAVARFSLPRMVKDLETLYRRMTARARGSTVGGS